MSPSMLRHLRRAVPTINRRTVGAVATVAVLSTAVVIAAVRADGAKATSVQLDDGSVWVTNQSSGRVGRLNIRVDELDLAIAAGSNADVVQQGRDVFFTGADGGTRRIDVVSGEPSTGKNSIAIADYQVNGGVAVLFDSASGKLWVGRSATLVGTDYPKKPDAQIEPGSKVVVTAASLDRLDASGASRGKVLVADKRGWYELALDDQYHPVREPVAPTVGPGDSTAVAVTTTTSAPTAGTVPDPEPDPIRIPVISPIPYAIDETTAATAVGDRLVFLKADGTLFSTKGKAAKVPGDSPKLQPAGPSNSSVLVASGAGLFEIAIGSDSVTQLSKATGVPAVPVRVGPCAYGAWSSDTPTWSKQCNGKVVVDGAQIPGAAANAALVYRVNQNNVALNSVVDGDVWADHDGKLAHVGNWADAEANAQQNADQTSAGPATRVSEKQCIDGGSDAPTTGDDQLGVRPRQTIIDVLYNDDDANCEPIAIASVDPTGGDWGQLTIIDNGQHLLYSPSQQEQDAAKTSVQTVSFTYTVTDTTGHTSSPPATVTMSVADVKLVNNPPSLRPKNDGTTRTMRAVVEAGRTISYDVLSDWWDPDGDDLRLETAVPQEQGQVSASPDGVVRYSANGVSASVQKVDVTISDGLTSATAPLEVTVKPSGSPIPPITANDFITLVEGASGTVYPLANDSDPNEDILTLQPGWKADAPGFRANPRGDGAIDITAVTQGTYALPYKASDGTDQSTGVIRLEVLKPNGTNYAPVAVPDQVKLRPDRVVNVDVLANDIDPNGELLAITQVDKPTAPTGVEVRASPIDRRLVQVEVVSTDGKPVTGTFFVTYHVSDGRDAERASTQDAAQNSADNVRSTGVITLTIVPSSTDQPPVAVKDSAVVRTGDVVAVPVLVNDSDPDGDALVLKSVDPVGAADLETKGDGVAWISGRSLYFKGGTPGSKTLQYTVEANGKEANGVVTLTVTAPPDPVANPDNAPSPKPLVLRAVRNATVRLAIPLFDVDPDGDSVTLLDSFGGLQGAAQGNSVKVDPENPGTVLFTAGSAPGPVDQFDYTLRDASGETGSATVKVVVLDNQSWPPAAHDDVFRGKPGRTLRIPLLANDTSPQDNALELAAQPFFDANGVATDTPQHPDAVKVLDQTKPENRGRIEVQVPTDGSTLSEHYRIDDRTNPSDAFVRVTPDPNAPNIPPVATAHVVGVTDVAGKDSVTVNVLTTDYDPDDDRPLNVSIPATETATAQQGVVTIPLTVSPQLVLYRLSDADQASTIGMIRVPGKENHPPQLSDVGKDPKARTVQAGAVTPLPILLDDIVVDPDKDPKIRLTNTEVTVLAGQGTVSRLDGDVGFTYLPPANLTKPMTVTIQFEVTDRPDSPPADRQLPTCNCLATLSVIVNVQASSPPRIVSQGNVTVPQLDEPVSFDLAPLAIDDQDDPLTFKLLDSKPGGLDAQLTGTSTLTLVSHLDGDSTLPVGTHIALKFSVTDGTSDPVEGTVNITIIATNKGQPAAHTFADMQAERGVPLALPNLLDQASNPFPTRPLTLLGQSVDGGTISCTPAGDCQFRSDAVGTFHLSYTLKDAARQTAQGSITIVVKGKPLAPGVPTIDSVGDHVVNLTWTAADMQGGVFKTYQVTAVEAGTTMQFASTGGQFTGLTNGTTYHFTVLAENDLGLGDVSLPSSPAIPDRVPDPPVSPVFTDYGDGVLYLQWSPPATSGDFTAIQKYEISIGGQTLSTDGGTTTLVVPALQNGTDYTFKVRAQNKATTNNGWGEFSVLSVPERPSRPPDAPTPPAATNAGDGGTPRLTVTWNAPAFDGGRPITQYQVCRVQDAANCQTITTGLQATFVLPRNASSSFTVVAYNSDKHKNDSAPSAASALTIPVGNPDAPVISAVQSLDKALTVTASSTNNSGCSTYSLQYSINGGASWQAGNTFPGLVNGTPYTATAKTVLPAGCGTAGTTYESGASAGVSQTPYGPLQAPSISASLAGNVITWNWNANRADDGRPGWAVSVSGECGGDTRPVGSFARDFGYSSGYRTCTITVSASGVSSLSASAGQQTPAPPVRVIQTSMSASLAAPGTCGGGTTACHEVAVAGQNFTPNAALQVLCSGSPTWYALGTATASGTFSLTSVCYHDSGAAWAQTITVRDGTGQASTVSQW